MQILPKHTPAVRQFTPTVSIFHPGIRDALHDFDKFLSRLSACDALGNSFGVNLRVVLDACYIVANNKTGYLVCKNTTVADPIRWPDDHDELLPAGEYYYHLDEYPQADYQVVSEFAAWTLPKPIPSHWQRAPEHIPDGGVTVSQSFMSAAVKAQDRHCIVTMYQSSTRNARLIPEAHDVWFRANRLAFYTSIAPSHPGVNHIANGVTLRADVQDFLDRLGFVSYPAGGDHQFCAYLLLADPDYRQELHRREVEMPERVSHEFLFARFAYNIIGLMASAWPPDRSGSLPIHPYVLQQVERLEFQRLENLKAGQTLVNSGPPSVYEGHEGKPYDGEANMAEVKQSRHFALGPPPPLAEPISQDTWVGIESDDKLWKEGLTAAYPGIADMPEVDNPPDFPWSGNHMETPRMLRLRKQYIEQHPEVRAVAGPTASEDDVSRWYETMDGSGPADQDNVDATPCQRGTSPMA
ncbi:hypothetical protein C8Q80DRAFT_1158458 [Daedaleopsis nitida]|nr:hypothetical protein C8Q80DRAFT_1158458 [Daedaleopsis nitida]